MSSSQRLNRYTNMHFERYHRHGAVGFAKKGLDVLNSLVLAPFLFGSQKFVQILRQIFSTFEISFRKVNTAWRKEIWIHLFSA